MVGDGTGPKREERIKMEQLIAMKFEVVFSTSTCTSLGANGEDVVLYRGSASLTGITIASVEYHEQCTSEKQVIAKLKKIVREVNSNKGYSF